MIYCLKSLDGSITYLLNNNKYFVGRKNCEIIIKNDKAISRKHALLIVKNDAVFLEDLASTYNTFVNNLKIEANVEIPLKHGSKIQFGVFQSIYILEAIVVVTVTSGIKSTQKPILKQNIEFLGGTITSNWYNKCTHVTVNEVILTSKVLCAVIKGVPIVTCEYWDTYVHNVKNNLLLPEAVDFKPVCSEIILNRNVCFKYNPERTTLFKDKIFVFLTAHEKTNLNEMIEMAGGNAISWDASPLEFEEVIDCLDKYIIIQPMSSNTEEATTLNVFINEYRRTERRTIPMQEIALAILHCSCEKDCNPNFNKKSHLFSYSTQKVPHIDTQDILAQSTPSQGILTQQCFSAKDEWIIPHTQLIDKTNLENKRTNVVKENSKEIAIAPSICQENTVKESTSTKRSSQLPDSSHVLKKFKADLSNFKKAPTESFKNTSSLFAFKNDSASANATIDKQEVKDKVWNIKTVSTDIALEDTSKPNTFHDWISKSTKNKENDNSKNDSVIIEETDITENITTIDIKPEITISSIQNYKPVWCSRRRINPELQQKSLEITDPNIKEYIESLKNAFVISSEKEKIFRKPILNNSNHENIDNSFEKGKRNFKTFKKVPPLKPQTKIFPESAFRDVLWTLKGTSANRREKTESDDEDISNMLDIQPTPTKLGKRFQFK